MTPGAGSFLGRLAARGAAGVGGAPALRPDPWRGHEMAPTAGTDDPGPAAGAPGTVATAAPTIRPPTREAARARRPPGVAPASDAQATTRPALPLDRPAVRAEWRTPWRMETPDVTVGRPSPIVDAILPAPQRARETASDARQGRQPEPAVPLVGSEPQARPAPPVPTAEIAARALEPIPRAPPMDPSSEPEAAGPAAVEITIGRIELHNAPAPAAPRAAAPSPPAASGFAAYARLRAGIDPGRR